MPLKSTLFSMFGRSPTGALEAHMSKVNACAEALLPFFEAVLAKDWHKAAQLQQQISELEREADELKKDLRLHMPKSLFMPVPRSDILELLTMQDLVANRAKDIAGLILGRQMEFPYDLGPQFSVFLKRSIDAAQQAACAISELDDLLEAGFQGSEVKLVEGMINKLDEIEHDTDTMQVNIRRNLFAIEQKLPPIEMMFLYQVTDWIGNLADRAQQVGERLQLLLAH